MPVTPSRFTPEIQHLWAGILRDICAAIAMLSFCLALGFWLAVLA